MIKEIAPDTKAELSTPILRGGSDPERLYLVDLEFNLDGRPVKVRKTEISGVDMADFIVRHEARYYLPILCMPAGGKVLDFPCGGGYGAKILAARTGVIYEGRDWDEASIAYAEQVYGGERTSFAVGDLCAPDLASEEYDTIACIEGYEHIGREHQIPLLEAFFQALKPGGTLVITSPENMSGESGPSPHNKYHLWELTLADFQADLAGVFGPHNVMIVDQPVLVSTHETVRMFYALCKKQ